MRLLLAVIIAALFGVVAFAKQADVKPEVMLRPTEALRAISPEAEPCIAGQQIVKQPVIWLIRTKDGTVFSVGAVIMRQRC